jgi:hypothetical protein
MEDAPGVEGEVVARVVVAEAVTVAAAPKAVKLAVDVVPVV